MKHTIVIVLVATLTGCAADLKVKEIPNNAPAGTAIEGIPFRVPTRYEGIIYEKQGAKGYVEVARQMLLLPNPNRLFSLGYVGQPFASSSVDVTLNENNTIQQVILKSTSTGASALTAAGAQINSLAAALAARDKAGATSTTAAANLAIAADKAKQAADLAALQNQIVKASTSASLVELLNAENKERSAKLDANEAARLAGKASYFPDVVP